MEPLKLEIEIEPGTTARKLSSSGFGVNSTITFEIISDKTLDQVDFDVWQTKLGHAPEGYGPCTYTFNGPIGNQYRYTICIYASCD